MPTWEVAFDRHIQIDDIELIRAVAEAEAIAKFIRDVPLPPSVQSQLDRLNIMRAVHGTTGIEGADLDEEEVGRVLDAQTTERVLPASREREEQEVRNAGAVMKLVAEIIERESSRPLAEETICEMHRLTTQGIDYENNVPGAYRSHSVRAGTYVPPRDGANVRRLMAEFIEWLNGPPATNWPPVIRAIAAHFYFISIHPFGDGNGRTARAIESYLLYQAGVNVLGFYSLANFYYRRRAEYEQLLDFCRFNGDGELTPFVRFAVTGLVDELKDVHARAIGAITRIAFRDYYRSGIEFNPDMKGAVKGRLVVFMDELHEPVVEADLLSRRNLLSQIWASVSQRTMLRDLERLEDMDLIVREGGTVRPHYEAMSQFRR